MEFDDAFIHNLLSPVDPNFFPTSDCQQEPILTDDVILQVPVIQLLLGQVGLVTGDQMLSIWRYVVVGAVVAAAVLTPSTDPLTQMLLATPLLGLYLGGAWMVKLTGR